MNIDDLIKYYGNLNTACNAIDIAPQNMTKWKKQGYIPYKLQFMFAVSTEGKLIPDLEDPFRLRHPRIKKE